MQEVMTFIDTIKNNYQSGGEKILVHYETVIHLLNSSL